MKIIFSIFRGIENLFIIPKTRIIFGIAVISTFIIYFAMEASWTKALLFFGMIPFSLFVSGQFENNSGEMVKYQEDFNQNDNNIEDETPVVDRIERKTTNTTTTTETIYLKKGVKYLG